MFRRCQQRLFSFHPVLRHDVGLVPSSSSRQAAAASASCTHHQHFYFVTFHCDYRQRRYIRSESAAVGSSNRSNFKSTPIIPSILSHIEKIGVGIRPKPSRRRRRRPSSRGATNDSDTLDEIEEREYFRQSRETSRQHSTNRQRSSFDKSIAKSGHRGKVLNNNNNNDTKYQFGKKGGGDVSGSKMGAHWLPPPPFSVHSTSTAARQRRPVKILGSAASLEDDLPRESKGLSEVALAGRSNVGKSTLLNALLYGNIDETLSPRKYQRGRTPEGAKLPKGVKAITSDKPGETKRMSFYQLTADVSVGESSIDADEMCEGKAKKEVESEAIIEATENNRNMKYSLVLVDLPGFGFAFAKEEKAKGWNDLMHHYLLERKTLKRILLLLDARHGFKLADFEFLQALQYGLTQQNNSNEEGDPEIERRKKRRRELPPIQIVLTKCDLVKQADLARRVVVVRQQLSDALAREPSSLPVMLVSARAGLGFNNIRGADQQPMGGVLELQKELASLVPMSKVKRKN